VAVLLVEQGSENKGKKVETLIKNKQECVIGRIMLQRKGNVPVKKKRGK